MIISRLSPFLCMLAVSTVCFSIRAEDNAAQAAARVALAKALFDANAQQVTNAPANAAAPVQSSEDAKAKAKADKSAAAAKAKRAQQDAERQQEAEAKAAEAKARADRDAAARAQAETEARAKAARATQQPQMQAPVQARTEQESTTPVNPTGDNPAQAAARMALAKQMFEVNSQQPNTATQQTPQNAGKNAESQPVVVIPAPAPAPAPRPVVASKAAQGAEGNYVGKELGLKQIQAPALPINASKAARLQSLLEQYKADQISPEEYHKQRAAILSEP